MPILSDDAGQSLRPDLDHIREMLESISIPGEPFEVRILNGRKQTPDGVIPDSFNGTQNGFFTDVESAVAAVTRFNGANSAGVHVTLNALAPHVLSWGMGRIAKAFKATSDGDVTAYRYLYLDLDPVRPSDTNATDAERECASDRARQVLAYLRDLGWPDPVWTGSSGSGSLMLARIDLGTTKDNADLVKRVLEGLSDLFSDGVVSIDTTVSNPARVCRLAGTVNAKAITPTADRPWRRASGKANSNAGMVTREQLEAIAATDPEPSKGKALNAATGNGSPYDGPEYDLATILADSGIHSREKQRNYGTVYEVDCLTSTDHTGGACFIQFANGAVAYRCLHQSCSGKGWRDVKNQLKLPESLGGSRVTSGGKPVDGYDPGDASARKADTPRVAVIRALSDIEAKPIEWLMPGYLARGMLTLFGGFSGDGKSTICTDFAARFSVAGLSPDGKRLPYANSLFLSAEEDPQYALKPRLSLHRADHGRIFTMRGTTTGDGETAWINLKTDMPQIRAAVIQYGIDIIWIDPITSYLPGTDRNNEGNIRDALSSLQALMEETGVAVVGIAHIGKGDGTGRRAEQRLLGSTAFVALARMVWMLARLPDEHQPERPPDSATDGRKDFGVVKSNYSIPPQSLMFERPLDGPLQWLGPAPITIAEALTTTKPEPGGKSRNAMEWLAERLAGGAQRSDDVMKAAKAAGISETTLKRARAELNVLTGRDKTGWYMRLSPGHQTAKGDKGGQSENVTLFQNEHNEEDGQPFGPDDMTPFPNEDNEEGDQTGNVTPFLSYQRTMADGDAHDAQSRHHPTEEGGQARGPYGWPPSAPSQRPEPEEPLAPTGTEGYVEEEL